AGASRRAATVPVAPARRPSRRRWRARARGAADRRADRGARHPPRLMAPAARVEGLFLTPGAGSSADHPSLRAIEAAVAPLPVIRHDFPSRREGRRAPDRAPVLIADVVEAVPGK